MVIPVETIFLDAESDDTLQHKIQRLVTDAVLSGRFAAGERMPSTRMLARHLGVARNTVALSYTELVANGYLTARGRSGYFVSADAPRLPSYDAGTPADDDAVDWAQAIAHDYTEPPKVLRPADWRDFRYPFIYGQSDASLFDHQNWRVCAVQALGKRDFGPLTHDYYEHDDPVLIEYILRQILPRRGIAARPENILLTMGAQNALWIAAQILLSPDRIAVMENPGYPSLRNILASTRCRIRSVDVDAEGLPPEMIPHGADVVFVTPSHHCPTNATMPVDRRKALLSQAEADGFLLVEDDYEFEMAFLKSPFPALKSLDRQGRVIYTGSFSKSLFPGLRLGYLVAPAPFIRHARSLRALTLRHTPGHIQRTAAYFLSLGHYDALIERMGRVYRKRRAVMEAAIEEHGLDMVDRSISGGSSFWIRAPASVDTSDMALKLWKESVVIEPGHAFFAPGIDDHRHYRLAYSSIASERIPQGIALLAAAQRRLARH
ncbi:MAG: PLP-dependent aminotransferase family protein [Pseudomonadota bacterium]